MPTQPPRPCARPGCTILTTTGYCEAHAKARRAERNNWRGTPASRGYDKAWTATRLRYISRHPLCEDCAGRGITRAATLVHHLRPISEAPEQRLDENNLRALCNDCHEGRHGRRRSQVTTERAAPITPVTIVCGPPGSGKSTWVDGKARAGDFRFDVDSVRSLLFGLPEGARDSNMRRTALVVAARDAMVSAIRSCGARAAFVIVTGTNYGELLALQNSLDAEVVVLAVPEEECLRRIANSGRQGVADAEWADAVERWWRTYRLTDGFAAVPKKREEDGA